MKLFGPPARAAILVVLSACKFDPSSGGPTDASIPGDDANVDAEPDAAIPVDAAVCFGTGIGNVCLPTPPANALTLVGQIDTGVDANCTHVLPIGGVSTCIVAGTTVNIANASSYRGVGMRPLVIIAAERLTIDGTLNVGSIRDMTTGAGALTAACAQPGAPGAGTGGSGGGAGGTFIGVGGTGGTGDINGAQNAGGSPAAAITATIIRGGCAGGNGATGIGAGGSAGAGGGAVYLMAGVEIRINSGGSVAAFGAGGGRGTDRGSGGGGGSGGMIGLDAPSIVVAGTVAANGGGGGEGGGFGTGNPGQNGSVGAARAAGGSMGDNQGGNGGLGSGGVTMTGGTGDVENGGGGGGGGGAGYIYVKGTLDQSGGTISPAADVQ